MLSFELGDAWERIGEHPGYDRATILLRWHSIPVASLNLKLEAGRVNLAELEEKAGEVAWEAIACEPAQPQGRFAPSAQAATVIVCTRERPDDLHRCLTALLAMPDDGQRILVVDNNPRTTLTRDLVSQFPSVVYLREDQPGANSARNCGILAAETDLVAFMDDDAVADPHWLRAILSPFADPQVQCATGLTMPLELESEAQEFFERATGFSRRGFKRREFQSPATDPLVVGAVGASVNMALRRSIIDRVGLMDPALGPGTPSMSGDDHEYFTRILRAGFRIVYEPAALNWHRHRRTWPELRHVMFAYGVGAYASWTRSLLFEREWLVLLRMFGWFRHDQAPAIFRSLRRTPGAMPLDLLLAELVGCWTGPGRYLKARRRFRKYQDA